LKTDGLRGKFTEYQGEVGDKGDYDADGNRLGCLAYHGIGSGIQ